MKRVLFPLLAAHILFPMLWVVLLAQDGPRPNDWRHFQIAAEQFVSGEWRDLYTERLDTEHAGYFWRYPPYALFFVAPLAWMPPVWAYALLAGIGTLALAGSLVLLARLTRPRESAAWALAILLSAPALTTAITGQISGLLLGCLVAGGLLWTRGRPVAACALMGLLAIKPNVGVFFAGYVIIRGEWRGALAMAATVLALCASTLPLGPDLWRDFFRVSLSNVNVLALYDPYKMITLRAFLAAVFGHAAVSTLLWGAASVVLVGVAVRAWRMPARHLEQLGTVVLLAIAVNPYGFFYDALLLVLPATVWWVDRALWRRDRWMVIGVMIATAWCWEHWAHTWRELLKLVSLDLVPPMSPVGPIAAIWLVIASNEIRRRAHALHPERGRPVISGPVRAFAEASGPSPGTGDRGGRPSAGP